MKKIISWYKNEDVVTKFSIKAILVLCILAGILYFNSHQTEYYNATVMPGMKTVQKMLLTRNGNMEEFGQILIINDKTGAATLAYYPAESDFPGCNLLTRRDKSDEYAQKKLKVEYYILDGAKYISMADEIMQ